ncbi:hypothetical protein PENTCL1PPCAC_12509, partial [Pristionchus entomophagus]
MISGKYLKEHLKYHLDDNDPDQAKIKRPHKCEECGSSFITSVHLATHIRTHSEDETVKKPFECDICGNRFSQDGALDYHKKAHSKEESQLKIHECDV